MWKHRLRHAVEYVEATIFIVSVHLLSQHGLVSAGVAVFSCEYCDYRCLDKNRHEEHLAKHTGQMLITIDR